MEIGTFTFAEVQSDPETGDTIEPGQRLRDIVELATVADQSGLSVFGVGEHHRSDFAAAPPPWSSPRPQQERASPAGEIS